MLYQSEFETTLFHCSLLAKLSTLAKRFIYIIVGFLVVLFEKGCTDLRNLDVMLLSCRLLLIAMCFVFCDWLLCVFVLHWANQQSTK
jgi:hypothetical protein